MARGGGPGSDRGDQGRTSGHHDPPPFEHPEEPGRFGAFIIANAPCDICGVLHRTKRREVRNGIIVGPPNRHPGYPGANRALRPATIAGLRAQEFDPLRPFEAIYFPELGGYGCFYLREEKEGGMTWRGAIAAPLECLCCGRSDVPLTDELCAECIVFLDEIAEQMWEEEG